MSICMQFIKKNPVPFDFREKRFYGEVVINSFELQDKYIH